MVSAFTKPNYQSKPSLDFSVRTCSRLGCADPFKVTLLCLWILCGILSVPQGTIHGLLTGDKTLPLFMLLIFSTTSVGSLWVCGCLGRFLSGGSSGLVWSFLWSSFRVLVLFVGICSFLVLVCRELNWVSWTRNHVFHPDLAFSSLIFFSVVLSKSMCTSAFGIS